MSNRDTYLAELRDYRDCGYDVPSDYSSLSDEELSILCYRIAKLEYERKELKFKQEITTGVFFLTCEALDSYSKHGTLDVFTAKMLEAIKNIEKDT